MYLVQANDLVRLVEESKMAAIGEKILAGSEIQDGRQTCCLKRDQKRVLRIIVKNPKWPPNISTKNYRRKRNPIWPPNILSYT